MLSLLQSNVRANMRESSGTGEASVEALDWNDRPSYQKHLDQGRYSWVLGADLVYGNEYAGDQ